MILRNEHLNVIFARLDGLDVDDTIEVPLIHWRDTIVDLQSRLAQAEEVGPCEKHPKTFWVDARQTYGPADPAYCKLCEHTKLEVTARLQQAASVKVPRDDMDGEGTNEGLDQDFKESILALIPSDNASLSERRMNEAREEEAKWWHKFSAYRFGSHTPPCVCMFCQRLTELRRATAGKGQGE